jgi:hypothetical protein
MGSGSGVGPHEVGMFSNAFDGEKVFRLKEPGKHVTENFTWRYHTYTVFVEDSDGSVVKLAVAPVSMSRSPEHK